MTKMAGYKNGKLPLRDGKQSARFENGREQALYKRAEGGVRWEQMRTQVPYLL